MLDHLEASYDVRNKDLFIFILWFGFGVSVVQHDSYAVCVRGNLIVVFENLTRVIFMFMVSKEIKVFCYLFAVFDKGNLLVATCSIEDRIEHAIYRTFLDERN